MVLRLVVLGVLATSAPAFTADHVCGRVVAVSCSPSSVRLSVDSSPFVDPVAVEVAATDAERPLASQLLEHKVCATGESSRRDGHRVLTVGAMAGVEIKSRPSTSPALPAGVFRACDPGIQEPRLLSAVPPRTPSSAFAQGVQGTVVVEAIVAPDGAVGSARVTRKVHPDTDAAALAAVRQWRFSPALRDGTAVSVAVYVDVGYTVR
jgi:TonB family protein